MPVILLHFVEQVTPSKTTPNLGRGKASGVTEAIIHVVQDILSDSVDMGFLRLILLNKNFLFLFVF